MEQGAQRIVRDSWLRKSAGWDGKGRAIIRVEASARKWGSSDVALDEVRVAEIFVGLYSREGMAGDILESGMRENAIGVTDAPVIICSNSSITNMGCGPMGTVV